MTTNPMTKTGDNERAANKSQPPLSVPLSQFSSRASGGANFISNSYLRIMKPAFFILVFGLLMAGCHRPDANLARQITGTWNAEAHYGSETHYVTAVYAPDGLFSITTKGVDFTNDMAGIWRVEGKTILLTVTNASRVNLRFIGQVLKCRVDHVDSHQLDYQDIIERVGPTNTLMR
jgi:hypothetical protein